jgi:hypothetical protein
MKNFWYIDISYEDNKNKIGIDKGQYSGDVEKAIDAIKSFCATHEIKMVSHGWGYNDLIIEDKTHSLTPYGVDIQMMLDFCSIDLTNGNEKAVRLSQSQDRFLASTPKDAEVDNKVASNTMELR